MDLIQCNLQFSPWERGKGLLQDTSKNFRLIRRTPYKDNRIDFFWECENEWEIASNTNMENTLLGNPMK